MVGVAKAYTSRVGAGPMPTELLDETGETLQQGRPGIRHGHRAGRGAAAGWMPKPLRFTGQLNGVTELALTKLDVLDTLPVMKICTGYRAPEDPRPAHYWEGDAAWLETVQPIYEELPGWQKSTRLIREFNALPANAQAYVRHVQELSGVKVSIVSVGPERHESIYIG